MRVKHQDRQQLEIICNFCNKCEWLTPISLDLLILPPKWLLVSKESSTNALTITYLDFCSIECINKMDFNYA